MRDEKSRRVGHLAVFTDGLQGNAVSVRTADKSEVIYMMCLVNALSAEVGTSLRTTNRALKSGILYESQGPETWGFRPHCF